MTDVRNTPSTPSPEDLHVLAGEYVLGTLPAAERQAVEYRLPADPALQHAVAEWEDRRERDPAGTTLAAKRSMAQHVEAMLGFLGDASRGIVR